MEDLNFKPLQCPNCKRVYSLKTKATFEKHVNSCGKGQYVCDVCSKDFSTANSLKNHMKLHFGNSYGYECETCGKVFSQKFSLTLHSAVHMDKSERSTLRHKCDYCDKSYAWRATLNRHMQDHYDANVKSYSCDSCGQGFPSYSKYYHHKCTSTSKKTKPKKKDKNTSIKDLENLVFHRCQLCNRGFKERKDLDRHVTSCDPFHIEALSKDEREGLDEILTLKIAKAVSLHNESSTTVQNQEESNAVSIEDSNEDGLDETEVNKNGRKELSGKTVLVSPTRRTQRIRKRKQFPGFDVDLQQLDEMEEKTNTNERMEMDKAGHKDIQSTTDARAPKHKKHNDNKGEEKDGKINDTVKDSTKVTDPSGSGETTKQTTVHVVNSGTYSGDAALSIENDEIESNVNQTSSPVVQSNSQPKQLKGKFKGPGRQLKSALISQADKKITEDHSRGFKELREKKLCITYKCITSNCCKTFIHMKEIALHKKLVHKEVFRNLCTKCNKEFGSYNIYKSHLRVDHSDENSVTFSLKNVDIIIKDKITLRTSEILVCTKCGYRYGSHEDSSHKCEPEELCYFCPCCPYTSKLADEISQHITTTHAGEYHEIKNKDKYVSLRSGAKEPGWQVGNEATTCDLCHSTHDTNEDLILHLNKKHAVLPFACGLCRTCYGRRNPLLRHLLTHKKSYLVCNVCQKEFYEKSRLEGHMLTHTGERPFQCEVCGNRYVDQKGVKKHMQLKHFEHFKATYPDSMLGREYHDSNSGLTPVMCHQCGKNFSLDKYLKKHMKFHDETYIYKCPHCDAGFKTKAEFRKHKLQHMTFDVVNGEKAAALPRPAISKQILKTLKLYEEGHSSGLPYRCGACNKRFRGVKAISLHIRTMHVREGDKRHQCTMCKQGFALGSALRNHMRLHYNSKPYRCKICLKRFRQLGHIRQHLLYHGKSCIECKICKRPFKTKQNLAGHVKIHCTILPYKCPVRECTSAFQSLFSFLAHFIKCLDSVDDGEMLECHFCGEAFPKNKITSHCYSHENDEKFTCETCGVSFREFSNLYFHKETSGHFLENELEKHCNTSDYTISQLSVQEINHNWTSKTLMSQYEYLQPAEEQRMYVGTNFYIEPEEGEDEAEEEARMEDNDGELMSIAEQLTHMASGVPFREVIVQASNTRDEDNEAVITISTLDEQDQSLDEIGEVNPDNVEVPEMNLEDTGSYVAPLSNTTEQADDNETYQYIIETVDTVNGDNSTQYDNEGIELTVKHTEVDVANEVVNEMDTNNAIEISLCETDEVEKLDDMVTETSVEEVVNTCDIEEQLPPDNPSAPIKFVDQIGNEIIVYVINEVGEQIHVTDSEEILNTVVQSGDYSIVENTEGYTEITATETAVTNKGDNNPIDVHGEKQGVSSKSDKHGSNSVNSINERISRNSMRSWNQPTRILQNIDKIKGHFNKELAMSDTNEKDFNGDISYRVAMNFYEDRSDKFHFECATCKKKFPSKKARNHHTKTHLPNNQRKYQCGVCGSGFHTNDKFIIHTRIHTKERPYKCNECGKTFTQVGGLQMHLRIHKGYFPFECTQCDCKFTANGQLSKHIEKHHPVSVKKPVDVECKTCGMFYRDQTDLHIHQLSHLNDGVAQNFLSNCNFEEGETLNSDILKDLVKGSQNKKDLKKRVKKFMCETCGLTLKGEAALRAHQLAHDPDNASDVQCKVCAETFPDKYRLDQHMGSHTGEREVCNVCGVYVQSSALADHVQSHSQSTCLSYQCEKCGKQYKLKYSFMRHVVECRAAELKELVDQGSVSNTTS